MVKCSCERCGKEFSQKSHYDSHNRRKTPCENSADKIKALVDKVVEEKLKELNNKKLIVENKEVNENTDTIEWHPKSSFYDLNIILNKILESKTYSDIAREINVAIGTVKRWIDLKNVPKSYTFELLKLAKIDTDYTKFTYKEKDQFFYS